LVACIRKSSTENERTTVVVETEIKFRFLDAPDAGQCAKNCCIRSKAIRNASAEMGFIKFGSRVDVFLPLNTNLKVQLNQKVNGRRTVAMRTEFENKVSTNSPIFNLRICGYFSFG